MTSPLIELRAIKKQFGKVLANSAVNLEIDRGTIHAIIGENGAGKSTAMKILYGIYPPTEGEIWIAGVRRQWKSPRDAIHAGIGMVHQHFMLAHPYTVLDNILLGAESHPAWSAWLPRALRPMERKKARQRLQPLMERYGLNVDLEAPISKLPVGIQQRVEILKMLYRESSILILDEPTAVLTPKEIVDFFGNLRRLKAEGKTVLIITHKLKEVMAIADRVSIFRAGSVVGEYASADTSVQHLADLMVGRSVDLSLRSQQAIATGDTALRVQNLNVSAPEKSSKKRLSDLSLSLRRGEILGVAGVEGNGQSELLRAILSGRDFDLSTEGEIEILGKNTHGFSARAIRDLGVGVLAEDRQKESLLMKRPLWENFLLGHQRNACFQRGGVLNQREARRICLAAMEDYDVRPRDMELPASALSGGNQQKLVVARELLHEPKLLIAAQPTRGVDVGAVEFIHNKILAARNAGTAVLLVSSELDEVLALSDRIIVLYGGAIAAEFSRADATEKKLGFFMGGGKA